MFFTLKTAKYSRLSFMNANGQISNHERLKARLKQADTKTACIKEAYISV
jgi:hypothetical protein